SAMAAPMPELAPVTTATASVQCAGVSVCMALLVLPDVPFASIIRAVEELGQFHFLGYRHIRCL
ncbi:MAG: hypothetical protein ACO2ZN_05340, partial [Paracoccaceae bacterium]